MPSTAETVYIKEHTNINIGTAGVGVAVDEKGNGVVHHTVITLNGVSVATTDNTTNGANGSLAVYSFPASLICVLGCVTNLAISRVGTGLTATSAVVSAVGTVASAADATLTSTEANIVPSTASTLAAGVGAFLGLSTNTLFDSPLFDGTTTGASPQQAFLNFATPDAGSTANDALLVTGTITITWVRLGNH